MKISRHVEFQMKVDFKGSHYPKDVVLYDAVSYRDLEEIMVAASPLTTRR